jgi:hypothetical protein
LVEIKSIDEVVNDLDDLEAEVNFKQVEKLDKVADEGEDVKIRMYVGHYESEFN